MSEHTAEPIGFRLEDADEAHAMVTSSDGWDVAVLRRIPRNEAYDEQHKAGLLTDEGWQALIDRIAAGEAALVRAERNA